MTDDELSHITCTVLRSKVTNVDSAAAFIHPDENAGFTGAGYPKALPDAIARRVEAAQSAGNDFRVGLWTAASTTPDADGLLARAHGISSQLSYNSDPTLRRSQTVERVYTRTQIAYRTARSQEEDCFLHLNAMKREVPSLTPKVL